MILFSVRFRKKKKEGGGGGGGGGRHQQKSKNLGILPLFNEIQVISAIIIITNHNS